MKGRISTHLRGRHAVLVFLAAVGVVFAVPAGAQSCASNETPVTLAFTGGEQTVTVPVGVNSARVFLSGAQGGSGRSGAGTVGGSPNSPGGVGGLGARVSGTLAVTPGAMLSVWVGGRASQAVNPGGVGQGTDGIGGGATDIRVGGNSIANRVAIAGGGGGGGNAGWSTANAIPGGSGGEGGGGAGGAGGAVPGGPGPFGGGGGTPGIGGARGAGCGGFLATEGNATTGDGGDSFNFSGSFTGAGFGGGGGGGATVGGGGGGAGVGTTMCQQNWNGGGGGGGGGTSQATGLTDVLMSSGANTGDGIALICFAPSSPSGTVVVTDSSLTTGETSLVTVTFSQSVIGFANNDLTVENGTLSAVSSSDGGITWTATLTPAASVTDSSNVIVLDMAGVQGQAGNAGSGTSSSNNYAIDTVRPTATIVISDSSLAAGETSPVTITFSEAVSGFTNSDLSVTNGTLSAVTSADGGMTWTATFTPTAGVTDVTNMITLDLTGVTDAAGNAGSGTADSNNYAIDSQRPTASILVADTNLTSGETTQVTFTFSEPVSGFTTADLTVENATIAVVSSSDGGITWTATLTPAAGLTDPTNLITLDMTGVSDLSGNAGVSMTFSNNYAIATAPPSVISLSPTSGPASGGGSVVLTGQSFTGVTNVLFGSTSATNFTIDSPTQITATAPAGTGLVNVSVTTAGGTSSAGAGNAYQYVGSQAITDFAADPAAPTYSPNGTFTVSATGGASNNPVVFASSTAGVCTVSGTTVTMVSAGDCLLTADQAGNANYSAAPQVMLTVSIGKSVQTITFGAQANQTYVPNGAFALNPLATASSGLSVSYTSTTTSVCSITGTTVTMLSAGTCIIAADQAGDANYQAAAQVTQTIAIGQATQAITNFAANPAAPTYAPNGTFTLSAAGGASNNPVVFASSTAGVCTVSGATVTMVSAGECLLTADQAGNANYSAAPQVMLTVSIGKALPEVSWTSNLSKTFGESDFDLPPPTSSSPAAFTFASSNTQVATLSGRKVTITGAGTTTLTASQAATTNYQASSISIILTVNGRPDPTQDKSVVGTLQAQVDASVRFVQVQQDNVRSRMQQLRAGSNASSNNLSVSFQGGWNQPGLSLNANQAGLIPSMPQGWGFWSAGSIVVGERDGNRTSSGFDFGSDGVSFGVDRKIGNNLVLGSAVGLGWNDTDLDDGRSTMDARQRSLSIYGLWKADAWFVDGVLGLGRLDFDIVRWSAAAGANGTAKREGDQAFGAVTLGYEHRADKSVLTGYGRLDASRTTLDTYRETGLGIYDLIYAEQDVDSSTAAVGVEGRYDFWTEVAMVRPFWTLEWRQALQNRGNAGINYVVQPNTSDYVLGLRSYNDNVAALGAGVDIGFGNGWSMSFHFKREQARSVFANSFGLRLTWGQTPLITPEQLTQWENMYGLPASEGLGAATEQRRQP